MLGIALFRNNSEQAKINGIRFFKDPDSEKTSKIVINFSTAEHYSKFYEILIKYQFSGDICKDDESNSITLSAPAYQDAVHMFFLISEKEPLFKGIQQMVLKAVNPSLDSAQNYFARLKDHERKHPDPYINSQIKAKLR